MLPELFYFFRLYLKDMFIFASGLSLHLWTIAQSISLSLQKDSLNVLQGTLLPIRDR